MYLILKITQFFLYQYTFRISNSENIYLNMSSGRARLPPTPTTTTSNMRHQNIDVQNNSIRNTSSNETYTTNSQIYNNNNINDDSINALGPDLAIATSQVLESLSDHERQIIMDVLSRDENVRQRDAARIM